MKPFPKNPILFMWLYAWRNKKLFGFIVLALIFDIITSKLSPFYFSKLTGLFEGNIAFSSIKREFYLFLGLMVGCTILKDVCRFIFEYLTWVKFRPLVYKQMGADLFLYLSKHSINFFANNMAGALAQKGINLADNASSFYTALLYYGYYIGGLIFTFILLLTVNVWLAIIFFIILFVSLKVMMKYGHISIKLRKDMTDARNKVAGNMIDALQNNFFVRIFNGFTHEKNRAIKVLEEENKVTLESCKVESLISSGQTLYFGFFYLSFVLYGFFLWRDNQIDTSQLVLIILLLRDISSIASYLIMRAISYKGLLEEMRTNLIPFATPHDITDVPNAKKLKVTAGKIEFRNVCFSYKDGKHIFNNFSIVIEPKQKVGIVGMSGSGKSTFINLIERFFDVQSGAILIDEQDIKSVTTQSLHEAISYVAQTTTLLARSINKNIAYGKPEAKVDEIKEASKNAYIHKFISKLPNRYATILDGENKLSGGQMQRISIARAILKNAPILILDEATSALDSESEMYIQKAINTAIKDKTVITVAHRLSTLKNMDRIIVLEKGKVIEDGSFNALLNKKNGQFAKFYKLQQLEEKNNE